MSADSSMYLTPDEINQRHGKPTWRCWKCKADSNLFWFNGWSVAVCKQNTDCVEAYRAFIKEEIEAQDAFDAYGREMYGDAWDRGY